jgi:hypothetical protein
MILDEQRGSISLRRLCHYSIHANHGVPHDVTTDWHPVILTRIPADPSMKRTSSQAKVTEAQTLCIREQVLQARDEIIPCSCHN